jgi:alpha-tubulin suppressor-like RCC1 family protein
MITTFRQKFKNTALLLGLALWLSACGGGDSDQKTTSQIALTSGNSKDSLSALVPATVSITGPTRVVANTRLSYQASVIGGAATGISWDWGEGSVDSGAAMVQKLWRKPGSFTVTFSATVNGHTLSDTQTVVVTGTPVAAGEHHTCALQPSGSVRCWGQNWFGELGNGTAVNSNTSVPVTVVSDTAALASGTYHTCALHKKGTVRCWGYNYSGQLGNGSTVNSLDSLTSVNVIGLTDTIALASGTHHTCALQASGTVRCWGENGQGQLGNGSTTNSTTSVAVSGLTDAVALVAGGYVGYDHTCALQRSGSVRCWGYNGHSQLGNGSTANSTTSVAVKGIEDAVALAAGGGHTCALQASGSVRCWGVNRFGQLGNGGTADSGTSVAVVGLTDAVTLTAGLQHTCALQASGSVRCWGYNYEGQLGNDVFVKGGAAGVTAMGLTDAVALAAGANHTCALHASGSMRCWGYNFYGQLGDGTLQIERHIPTAVLGGAVFWK